jgi:rod shape-determining protein MreC
LALLSLILIFADSRFNYLSQLRYYVTLVITPVHYLAELPGQGVSAMGSLFQTRHQLQTENVRLQEQILLQQYQLQKLEHLTVENRRLNELLEASSIVDERVVRTQLIGESSDPFTKRVLINKGESEGVYVGQPVLDAYGLMGQVVEVAPLTSWVLLITDPQSATPVQINRNGIRAIAAGTSDNLHLLTLNNMPNTADIQVGDVLVTSGLGQRFPEGYPVGVINGISNDPGQPFSGVVVAPAARIDRSRNLLLVFKNRTSVSIADATNAEIMLEPAQASVETLVPTPEVTATAQPVDPVLNQEPASVLPDTAARAVIDVSQITPLQAVPQESTTATSELTPSSSTILSQPLTEAEILLQDGGAD